MEKYGYGFDELYAAISENPAYDKEKILKAFQLALDSHKGQTRFSGEPYIIHPVAVAKILLSLNIDSDSIAAALLHDVVEDTDIELNDVRRQFGESVAFLVDGVTKLGKVNVKSKEEQQAENIRKMLMAMSNDVRVIIIKLADRLHNMRTLNYMNEQKRRDKALETLEIYAPIAHRLGIRAIKEELEDLAIRYLDPVAYNEISETLKKNEKINKDLIPSIIEKISARLKSVVDNAQIDGRIKSVHGIYRKMYIQNHTFDEIYDIYAVRIIVDSVNDCYNCLGVIHDMYRPIPGRFKDYISTPKPNMYQSLHSTLIGNEGIPFEVQIRTWEMHYTAEFGIAAHWKYKSGISGKDNRFEEKIAWIREMLETQQDNETTPEDFLTNVKSDLAFEDVYVFTPKGDVKNLPIGSTVIDFAYAIHTAVGNRMTGAKVNGRIVPLDYKLNSGEICDIIVSNQEGKGPSRDWLNIVRTSGARNKIRSWFKKERREENIISGKNEIEKEFKRNYIRLTEDKYDEFLRIISDRQKCGTVEEFYAKIGYGAISVTRLMPAIKELYSSFIKDEKDAVPQYIQHPVKRSNNKEGIIVEGFDNTPIKLSRCCNPLPGDEIIGFITRGHGISVHKRDCLNVPKDIKSAQEPDRWVRCSWNSEIKADLNSTLSIYSINRDRLMSEILEICYELHMFVNNINGRVLKDGNTVITINVSIDSTEQLKNFVSRINRVDGVISVERTII